MNYQPLRKLDTPERNIICADSGKWMDDLLREHPSFPLNKAGELTVTNEAAKFAAVVTSLPDAEETGMDLNTWKIWFVRQIRACCQLSKSYAFFYQTDRKTGGQTISKAALVFAGAEAAGMQVKWHKITLRRQPGKVDLFRPGYTHLICVGWPSFGPGRVTPDVFDRGEVAYKNGMGLNAAARCFDMITDCSDIPDGEILDPFCGQGTVPAVANKYGYSCTGIDILPEQVEKAWELIL